MNAMIDPTDMPDAAERAPAPAPAAVARPSRSGCIARSSSLDQMTKAMVRATLPLHDSVTIIPGFLDFTHVQNTGAAFGLLNAADFPFKTAVMIVHRRARAGRRSSLYARQLGSHERLSRYGLALIIGGAAGNLIDRVDRRLRRRLRRRLLGRRALLGVQRRRRGDHRRGRPDALDMLGIGRQHVSKPV